MECKQCNKEIEIISRTDTTKKFCDSSCAAKYNNSHRIVTQEQKEKAKNSMKKYLESIGHISNPKRIPKTKLPCIICGIPTGRQGSLCRKCRTLSNSCKKCGKLTSGKYCIPCKNYIYKHEIFNLIDQGNYNKLDTRWTRIYLTETRGHACEICKTTEWMSNPIPLNVDHINGRALDNRPNNIRLICPNCDRFLPTYGSKNKNSDRVNRYKKSG